LSILLSAQATKSEVNLSGSGECTIFDKVEDLRFVYFE
jgi:hypothetical protein